MTKKDILEFYRRTAYQRERWNKRNRYYHRLLETYYAFVIPQGKRVVEIGCGSGDLLNAVKPSYGVGIDFVPEMIEMAKLKYANCCFYTGDVENIQLEETFDYIIISDTLGCLWDAQAAIRNIRKLCHAQTRIVISQYNFLWEPVIKILECLGLKQKSPNANWFSNTDVANLLELEDFQVIKTERKILFPLNIPLLSVFLNGFIGNLPALNHLCLVNLIVARLLPKEDIQASVSIIIPARNERGNIENAIKRTPVFGTSQEFIFIEGHSSDNTYQEMERVKAACPEKNIKLMRQTGKGKGNAVREAFDAATGDVLMILDADLTVSPEELPKFTTRCAAIRANLSTVAARYIRWTKTPCAF